jgi:ER-bound oxygenase mpaB/B'/Rubber oxygenase, catalytic domain
MPNSKWSDDAFLDGLRRQGDPQADAAVAQMAADGQKDVIGAFFKALRANDTPLPLDSPQPLKDFMAASAGLPPGLDWDRLQRGGEAFLRNGLPSVVVLLASSLPRGYAAPCLCEILSISRDLEGRPFDRLMGVVQLLINISDGEAFQPGGRAVVTAQKLRLLHAGVRRITRRTRPHYQDKYGVPVNHEDMLATIMGFSYLLVDGIGRLGLTMKPGEADDLYYLWRVFGLLMGIHPEGQPHDDSLIPADLSEAAEFYASFVRRHNTLPDTNPKGVVLTQDNLNMMEGLLPRPLRWIGLRFAPRILMTELMQPDELARVGVSPLVGHSMVKAVLTSILRIGQRAGEHDLFAARIARFLLQGMVDVDRGGEVEFGIAFSRLGLRSAPFT